MGRGGDGGAGADEAGMGHGVVVCRELRRRRGQWTEEAMAAWLRQLLQPVFLLQRGHVDRGTGGAFITRRGLLFSFSTCSASELFAIYVRKAGASKAKAVAHTIRREHSSRLPSLPRAQFTLLPETSPLASPRRWRRNSHSASLPFLGKPIPRFGAHHKADLRKREEDERDPRTKLRAAPTDQTLGVRRASPRRRRRVPRVALVSPKSSTVQLDPPRRACRGGNNTFGCPSRTAVLAISNWMGCF